MTNDLINNLIDAASARIGELTGETNPCGVALRYFYGDAEIETPKGNVYCFVSETDKHYRNRRHLRATFKLNGKVISRVNLEKALNQ